jgi:hypothetical protein
MQTDFDVGVDKYFNKLADWGMYLSPYANKVVPVSSATFMHLVGVVGKIAGINRIEPLDKDRQLYCYGLVDCDCREPDDYRHFLRPCCPGS